MPENEDWTKLEGVGWIVKLGGRSFFFFFRIFSSASFHDLPEIRAQGLSLSLSLSLPLSLSLLFFMLFEQLGLTKGENRELRKKLT